MGDLDIYSPFIYNTVSVNVNTVKGIIWRLLPIDCVCKETR